VGKTRVLTTRIAHIVSTGRARAHEILAVTFTNKAAREMRQRVAVFSGSEQAMPWLGTFHSVGAKILRMHAELVGLRPNFTILDTDDQLRLLKQLLQAEHLDDKRWPARALANLIDGWKNRIDPGGCRRLASGLPLASAPCESYQGLAGAQRGRLRRSLLGSCGYLLTMMFYRLTDFFSLSTVSDTGVVRYLLLRLLF
jgi:DNA helicase-2/ATP-dependent DNA helicase PcrA